MNRDTKRQDLPSGLWVVATPIGNLSDLSPRAHQALEEAHAIYCEDTRRSASLLQALGIAAPLKRLVRYDAHSSEKDAERAILRLQNGENITLITDAGTPGISDPGSVLVQKALESGIQVSPIPGPSDLAALLSVSGFIETTATFGGFFPRKAGEQKELLERILASQVSRVFVWFEAPNRISETLAFFAENVADAKVTAAKELTKIHETLFHGTSGHVARLVEAEIKREGAIGEWCFAILLAERSNDEESSEWVKALHCLLDVEVSASRAAQAVSQHFGAPRNTVYRMALELSSKKDSKK